MTAKEALTRARQILVQHNVEDAPLESEVLLRYALNITRVQLYQDIRQELPPEQEKTFWQLIERRCNHEPTAYITGHCEFYGLDFYVDPNVLIPRPGSELLVEEALAIAGKHSAQKKRPYLIAEAGTGSGAISIALAKYLPQAKIYTVDISAPAIGVAARNCRQNGVEGQITLLQGDMLAPVPEPVDLIVANLPYITDKDMEELSPEIRLFEPTLALAGGEDGLDKIRQLCRQIRDKLNHGGSLLLEIGLGQASSLTSFLQDLYPVARIKVTPDYAGIDRVVDLTFPGIWGILSPTGLTSYLSKTL
ncbi:peptide chain release factor N(5)-glutamine methyltransferase [Chloroflexota bacterium]